MKRKFNRRGEKGIKCRYTPPADAKPPEIEPEEPDLPLDKLIKLQLIKDDPSGLCRRYYRFVLDATTYSLLLVHYAICSRRTRVFKFIPTGEWLNDRYNPIFKMEKASAVLPLDQVPWDEALEKEALEAFRKKVIIVRRPALVKKGEKPS